MDSEQIINKKLEELLLLNETLPKEEQFPLDKFILDEEDFERKIQNAEAQIEAECQVLDKEAREHQKAVRTVLQTFWHDLDQPSRTISGLLDTKLQVRNFPVAKESVQDTEEFQKELQRNEMYLSMTRFIAFRPWELMTDSELAEKQHKSPLDLRSFKSIAEGFQRMLSEAARRPSTGGSSAAPTGSISRLLLSPEESQALSLLENCDQVELNLSAYEATKHALLLARLIRDLRYYFNKQFEVLRMERKENVEKFGQNGVIQIDQEVEIEDIIQEKTTKTVNTNGKLTLSKIKPDSEEGKEELSGKDLKRMEENLSSFDKRLKDLGKLRYRVNKAVTQEELKVARIKLWILTQSVLFSTESNTREELKVSSEAVEALSRRRHTLQARCERRRRRHERLLAHDKRQDKIFQQHFTLNSPPAVVQQLSKLYRRRPAIQLSATQLRMMDKSYLRTPVPVGQQQEEVDASEDDSEVEEAAPLREPCKLYMAALKIMDVTGKRSSVDATAWTALCKLRRAKVEAEIRAKATALEVSEVEQSIAGVDVDLTMERNKEKRLRDKLDAILDKKRRVLLDIELQILLPLGQIEVKNLDDPKEIEDAILVPRKSIKQLNDKIKAAGAAKMVALERSTRFREGQLETAKWHLQKATLQLQILKDELKHVEKLPITSEIKKYLKGQPLNLQKVKSCQTYEKELMRRRCEKLEAKTIDLKEQRRKLAAENSQIEKEIEQVKLSLAQKPQEETSKKPDDWAKMASEKSRLERIYKKQEDELQDLREQLEKMRMRTFPNLFNVSF